jgi:hypothetical protein
MKGAWTKVIYEKQNLKLGSPNQKRYADEASDGHPRREGDPDPYA